MGKLHKLTKADRQKAAHVTNSGMTAAQRKKRAQLAVAKRWANFYANRSQQQIERASA